jgi:hypothetical protein
MTKFGALLRKIAEELEPHRSLIDNSRDLRGVRLDIKFADDCLEPRTVVFQPEFERRKEKRPGVYPPGKV